MIKTGSKNAFTLAEVLTTLMVIGVVAAMTIPTLLNSTDDQQHRVALKKAVSVLSQAAQLNVAKEVEGSITSSKTLCNFYAESMSGSCNDPQNGSNVSIMNTSDGMVYGFIYRGDGSGSYHDFATECGSTAPSSQDLWKGQGARCLVLVDTNGGKGTSGFPGTGSVAATGSNTSAAIPPTATGAKDQFYLMVSSAGVFPVISSTDVYSGSRGYRYLYGDSAATPWGSGTFTNSDTRK